MTLQELRDTTEVQIQLVDNLLTAVQQAKGLLLRVQSKISTSNSFLDYDFPNPANVDNFTAIQFPLYIQLLTNVEVQADNLGTDVLH